MIFGLIIVGIAIAIAAVAVAAALSSARKDADKSFGNKKVGSTTEECPLKYFKIISLAIKVKSDPDNEWIMNDPDKKFEVESIMTYEKTANNKDLDKLPDKIEFSFNDPSPNNTKKIDSFGYTASKFLGKRDDASAIYLESFSGFSASSANSYKTSCKVTTKTLEEKKKHVKVYFKPSSVGGDNFKLKADVEAGGAKIKSAESTAYIVKRKIKLDAYEMVNQTHVSTNGTTDIIKTFYTDDTHVKYKLGTITAISAAKSVKYIGLWDHGTTAMVNWSTHANKKASETPTADETAKANGAAGAAQAAARAAITAKANLWKNRIISHYSSALDSWATDAGIPINTLISIEYEHPKYSNAAPDADSTTSEWGAYPWLRITVEGTTLHPDKRWIRGEGLSYRNRAYITKGMSALRTKTTIVHEAGHETKNQFKRKKFGNGDHTSGRGLMDPTGSRNSFTAGEKKILRGFK